MAALPVRTRFSRLAANVKLNEDCTVSVPSPIASERTSGTADDVVVVADTPMSVSIPAPPSSVSSPQGPENVVLVGVCRCPGMVDPGTIVSAPSVPVIVNPRVPLTTDTCRVWLSLNVPSDTATWTT